MIKPLDMGRVLVGILNVAVKRQGLAKIKEVQGLSDDFKVATVLMSDGNTLQVEASWLLPE